MRFSTSNDRTLHLWEAATGRVVAKFTGDGPLPACAAIAGWSILVAGETSGVIHFLRLQTLVKPECDPIPHAHATV
jgi:hypothetical protein